MLSLIIMAWLNSLNDVHTFCHLLFDFHKSKEQKRWIWPIPFLINVFTALKGSQFSLSPAFSKKSGGTCFLTFRHSVRPSVRPSFRPSVPLLEYVPCVRNSSYSFIPILLKLHRCLDHALKICMWFGYYHQINFLHFFRNLNLVIFRIF